MKQLTLTIFITLFALIANAQTAPIMVCNQSGNNCTQHFNFHDAYTAANSGDYIYMSGGNFTINDTIKKKIHIYGAGSILDSSLTTGITNILNELVLGSGSDSSSFEGLFIAGAFKTNSIDTLKKITIKRCSFSNYYSINSKPTSYSKFINDLVRNNNTTSNNWNNSAGTNGYINLTGGVENEIQNSILNIIYNTSNSKIFHNIIIGGFYTDTWYTNFGFSYGGCINSEIKYNVFLGIIGNGAYPFPPNSFNSLLNNIVTTCAISNAGASSEIGTIIVPNDTLIFKNPNTLNCGNVSWNQTNNWNTFQYNATYNLRLVSIATGNAVNSPGKNYGYNGTDCGIYGGFYPWSDGLVPSNPHIYYKQIGINTNPNGDLPVNIKARGEN